MNESITRGEIAELTETSRETVRRHEKVWGLWAYRRRRPGLRRILYKRKPALLILRAQGLID